MNDSRTIEFLADYELDLNDTDLKELDIQLSQNEEVFLKEILELQEVIDDSKGDVMHGMLEVAKLGAMNYIDSMTDTGETFDRMKDPKSVQNTDEMKIERKRKSADPIENARMAPRFKAEARYTPFDADALLDTSGMSKKGTKKLKSYIDAYTQRTKSITAISSASEGTTISYKQDEAANFESLSGLRGYRVGPVVPMSPVDELAKSYKSDFNEGKVVAATVWIRNKNFEKFDSYLVEKFGFQNKADAKAWRKENHLTIHEGPDGMFLVPTDIHDAASHSGYCSMVAKYINSGATAEGKKKIEQFIVKEKIAIAKHELQTRGTRAVKGIGIGMVKEVLVCAVGAIIKESMNEFKQSSEDSFVKRMMRILQKSWGYVKSKCKSIINKLWETLKGSLLSEFLTMLNDFLFKTFKNVFRLIRQLWGSIKSAFKVIFSKDEKYTWKERVFEATKIISAGIVGVIGFSLNELIEKGLTSIGIPFASFISEVLSGLFAGVMSAMVLMLFDNIKKNYKANSAKMQQMLLKSKYIMTGVARMQISSIILAESIVETYEFFGQNMVKISNYNENICLSNARSQELTKMCRDELNAQKERTIKLIEQYNKYSNDEF